MALRPLRPRAWRILVAFAIISFLYLSFELADRIRKEHAEITILRASQLASGQEHIRSPRVQQYWHALRNHLRDVTPTVDAVRLIRGSSDADQAFDFDKNPKHHRLDVARLPEEAVNYLRGSHKSFLDITSTMAPGLPYQPGTRGIVTTAGGKYFKMVILSLRMLRRAGSRLPVVAFLDTPKDYDEHVCDELFPSMGAECVVLSELLDVAPPSIKQEKCQLKVFALLFSPFQEILFLDADAFPAHNPDLLFMAEPYTSTGMVVWPDFWANTASHMAYDIADIPVPQLAERRSSESGIMLYDKSRHARDLLLALYYNFLGPRFYYPMLSQGAAGEGDKETFLHAALVLETPFYDVKSRVTVMGRRLNETWHSAGMKQADPREDWQLFNAPGAKFSKGFQLGPIELKKFKRKDSSNNTMTRQAEEVIAKPFFIHNNIVKLDVEQLLQDGSPLFEKNATGSAQRLWGSAESQIRDFGYDVEKVMWEELVLTGCHLLAKTYCGKALQLAEGVLGDTLVGLYPDLRR
ncbi:hypothetical protein PFICI_10753 [Pestalotiopsis fici W106-1]|uniref:Uncharacterized protein n=1 Tax=Pestalotiopsis fici (strain W106-1 / CGMCC3.15140) TaxID=1229662 RepID=W3WSU3_PESFW|nr:uncharacterized protein PFICI_10753 [Pestalotiopsis fici W106-1]ETS76879.1 hypothetical protein PFICI_10753 [Pestalotiopsis fici W106-1]